MNIICLLFGHSGQDEEGGHHICSRCGLHSYYSFEEYQKSGYLFSPWRLIKGSAAKLIDKLLFTFRLGIYKNYDEDVPF